MNNRACECRACIRELDKRQPLDRDWPFYSRERSRMIVCAKCGNKRCPHANHHDNSCTGSNEPGQPGSAYA